ncbi:hypothetical protein BJV85_003248 [Clostridium acetobutylicum]|uniref:Predicted membrane protein n=1 Tax=Clostridium acetobutylicum (strain ATCC 824 / DSM 792 / JCM 1419 / IAM 19013 / LMG 5710 / NBRC 13948 / NRRL B-527 / VKM B-1787 / 2291 / W) TaxID=272562 RepID=Q97L05_CLOAB|nr:MULTISPECIES: hypothetical protein [Clostridium]AAK78737.1 Predicted membrane protein [Clostridium acetobutylicum ATCC 824]ADZ19811.1 membrane protein [Clostridium acetobutylicum EA 2018]AEI31425.1 hypothetical protein SMB_G0777 [Clostridium acetobutylicum DSM 1731]AWV80455.1 hypothetical protein DK921_10200 [Clostridium acetobutylicum]KHD37490.1 membrane protein [Clostridium acetobutylicum]
MIIILIMSPFIVIGLIPLLVGLHYYNEGKKYASESKIIEGEIVDIVKGVKVLDSPQSWCPVIKYWDERSNSYLLYKSSTGHTLKSKYTIGNKIELRHLYTDKGVDIRANTPMDVYGLSRQFMVVGAIITSISVIIMIAFLIIL